MTVARAGITHYAWPGGVAVIFDASTPCAAVFGSGGWQVGAPDIVFSDGPPAGAEVSQMWLSRDLVEQVASQEFTGAGLHTDFVHLDRYVARLQAEETHAVVLVLGSGPAALAISGGSVSVIEPSAAAATPDAVLSQARGWIVVIAGALHAQAAQEEEPVLPVIPALMEPAPAPAQPVLAEAVPAAHSQQPDGAFGRFPPEARYLLSSRVAENLPAEVAAEMASFATNGATGTMLRLLDGAHTLAQIVAETGLTPAQVGGMLDALVAHRLAFKYVSRARPATGASASR